MIRVAFVIDNLSRAGTETQLLALIRSLDRTVVTPSLVLLDGDNALSQTLEPVDCEVFRLGVTRLISPTAVSAAIRLRKHWSRQRPDVVVAYFLDSAYFALPLAKLCGAKTVRVRNNLGYWLTKKHRLFGRMVKPLTDVVLTNSDAGRTALEREGNRAVEVIENGVDLERFPEPHAVDVTKPVVRIGCVANLRPVKNLDGLIRAATTVCQRIPNVQFAIAGSGEQRNELENLISRMNLDGRVTLNGAISDIPAFLASCELAVLPSHSEGMSNALLEYMTAGRAIVATDVGANRHVLGETGVLVPPGDDTALSRAMQLLLSEADRSTNLGRLARLRAETHFSRECMVERFEQFFSSLVISTRTGLSRRSASRA